MQTVLKIQAEIDDLIAKGDEHRKHGSTDDKDYRAMSRRVKFLKECLMYLENKPTEEFINKQKATLTKKLERIYAGYQDWRNIQQTTKSKTDQQWQSQYNSEMGTSHIQNQIENIEFILS